MRRSLLLVLVLIMYAYSSFAQRSNANQVTGKLIDAQTKEALIGATVTVKGSSNATTTALNGTFRIDVPTGGATLVFTYIGYVSKEMEVTQAQHIGNISLASSAAAVKEIVVSANPSKAIDRQTPVAVSSVNQTYIEEKGAGAEFPELLKLTPSVTVTREGGGYGDSRINIRGFGANNVALIINGIPMNDVEAGKIYWSDWAGLEDVTSYLQIQRGLSASVVAIPAVGGSININTFSTQVKEQGTISQSIGSFNAFKTLISYSTGLTSKGWATSFLLSRSVGDGYAEGLYYTGYSYFGNVSKVLGQSNTLSLDFMGASQIHGQRYTYNTIQTYRAAPQGLRYNSDYGYLNGKIYSGEQNLYNKPLASLNHNWTINDRSSLTTNIYASYGTGSARYVGGSNTTLTPGAATGEIARTGDIYSPIDWNAVEKTNVARPDGSTGTYIQDTENDHKQYGLLSTYKLQIGEYFHFLGGVDLRGYVGQHFYRLHDGLGGGYLSDPYVASVSSPMGNINNPNAIIPVGGKFNNNYTYHVASQGIYLQGEYVKSNFSAFVTLAGSNTGNSRVDYFNYLNSDPKQKSPTRNFAGYQFKGGANYNIDAHNNIMLNLGFFQRAPQIAGIFIDKNNTVNPNVKPEKLTDFEIGYGFRSAQFSANVNVFRAQYNDRQVVQTETSNNTDSIPVANISGVDEVHQGIEAELKFRPVKEVTLFATASVGDYHYTANSGPVQITSNKGPTINEPGLDLKGLKIGDVGATSTSAQTTMAAGFDIQIFPSVKLGGSYLYYTKYYAAYDLSKINFAGYKPYQMPNYGVADFNIVYRFKLAGLDCAFIGNLYNSFNTTYIGDAYDLSPVAASSTTHEVRTSKLGVWYGSPRFVTTTFKIKF